MKDILEKRLVIIVLEMYSCFIQEKFFSFLGNMENLRTTLGEYTSFLKSENYEEQIREVDILLELTDEILENIGNAEMFLINENLIEIMYAVQGFRY